LSQDEKTHLPNGILRMFPASQSLKVAEERLASNPNLAQLKTPKRLLFLDPNPKKKNIASFKGG